MRFDAEAGMSRMPTLRERSRRQTKRRAGSGSLSMRVLASPATALMPPGLTADTAWSRFGRSRRMRTTSVSSGVAPSM
jgi:hypothetical protein